MLFLKKSQGTPERFYDQIDGIKQVFKSWNFWRIAPLATMSQAGFLSLQGLWAGPWLRDIAGMQRPEIATVLSWTALAMITGFICLGFVAEKLAQRGIPILYTAVTGMTIFMVIQVLFLVQTPLPIPLIWILFGFSALRESFPMQP